MQPARRVPLSSLDPAVAWSPWAASADDPWTLKWAGHLHRRAGFGATWPALQETIRRGPEATIEQILVGEPGAEDFDGLLDESAPGMGEMMNFGRRADPAVGLQGWWLYRILHAMHPLRERLTLFWHDHFATSVAKVQNPLAMKNQNTLIRRHALGSFRELLRGMGRDPAMMIWLDSNNNVRGRPNENYARELLELFSLGVGHYTEADIRDAARAFTGWNTNGATFSINRGLHDDGPKTILGETGPWDGDDVVRIVLKQPEAARFLVRKLFRQFISEVESPPDALVEPLAARFRASDYDVADLVGTMLRSRLFFSEHAYRARVKSPVEFVAGLFHTMVGPAPTAGPATPQPALLDGMGQTLFAPPNVKGWPGGESWINTATLLARHNLAWRVVQGATGPYTTAVDPLALVRDHAAEPDGAGAVNFLVDLLLQPGPGEIPASVRDALARFAAEGNPRGVALDRRLRETAHAILTLPEYQLA